MLSQLAAYGPATSLTKNDVLAVVFLERISPEVFIGTNHPTLDAAHPAAIMLAGDN